MASVHAYTADLTTLAINLDAVIGKGVTKMSGRITRLQNQAGALQAKLAAANATIAKQNAQLAPVQKQLAEANDHVAELMAIRAELERQLETERDNATDEAREAAARAEL